MDCSPPGSSVHGILQARILEWVAIPLSRGSSQSRDQTQVSQIAGGLFTILSIREQKLGIESKSRVQCMHTTTTRGVGRTSKSPSSLTPGHTLTLILSKDPACPSFGKEQAKETCLFSPPPLQQGSKHSLVWISWLASSQLLLIGKGQNPVGYRHLTKCLVNSQWQRINIWLC